MEVIKKMVALSHSWSFGGHFKLKMAVIMTYERQKRVSLIQSDNTSFCRKFYAEKESYRTRLSKMYQRTL